MPTETELRRLFVAATAKHLRSRVALYIRNVGVFKLSEHRFFRSGIKGQADIYGWYRDAESKPRPIEIELKVRGRDLTDEQKAWAKHCFLWGVKHVVLDAGTESDPINRWLAELKAAL